MRQEQERAAGAPPLAWMCAGLLAGVMGFGPALAAPVVLDTVEVDTGEDAEGDKSEFLDVDNYARVGTLILFPDSGRNVDYGLGSEYGYAWRWSGRNWIEARLATVFLETGEPGLTDFYSAGLGADYLRTFGSRPDRWFVLGGIGGRYNDVTPDEDDGVTAYANLGAGWRSDPWKRWGVRARVEARVFYDTFDAGEGSGQVDGLLGLSIEVLPERVKVLKEVVEKEVVVEKVVEKEVVREVEIDGDADGDGVPNSRDRCPDTIAGAVVDEHGCVREEQTITLPNIEFEYDKAILTPQGRIQLDPVLRFLTEQADIELEIHGHTDSQGTDSYNLKLSDARAHAVRAFLIENGVAAGRLGARGFGESRPIASNDNKEDRARNRRVELYIKGQPATTTATEIPGAAPPITAGDTSDLDGDGVPNASDNCVDTLAEVKVAADGCVREEQTVTLPKLEFEYSRGTLTSRGRDEARRILNFLNGQPGLNVVAKGYTDSQGTRSFNLWLSDQRAKAVRDYLVEKGIAADRVNAQGYGEENPIASNATKEERAKNRRVELEIRIGTAASQSPPAAQGQQGGGEDPPELGPDTRRPGR